jgi:stress response protein SCP2
MKQLSKGERCKLDEQVNTAQEIIVDVSVFGNVDYSCFGVDSKEKLSDDRYMIFYNQTSSPNNEITLSQNTTGAVYRINLSHLPASINKLVFTVSIDGNGTMNGIVRCSMTIGQSGNNKLQFNLTGKDFQNEKAIIVAEIYKKDVWRLAAVGSGFYGGLNDLLKNYGGEVAAPKPTVTTPIHSKSVPVSTTKLSFEKKLEKEVPALLSLAKPLAVSLEKHNLTQTKAKVALAMNIHPSMSVLYRNGTIQEIINKTIPLVLQFDDDGDIDFWYYLYRCKRMQAINIKNYQQAVPQNWDNVLKDVDVNHYNYCSNIIHDIINTFVASTIPVYVIFITNGKFHDEYHLKNIMIEASHLPIFWQVIGIGNRDFSTLQEIDTMFGRYVDNANFFALDDFQKVSNEELYDRLLTEFPQWLKEIRNKKMIPF